MIYGVATPISQTSQLSVTGADRAAVRRGEYLDENLFVEAIALCALQSKAFEKDGGNIEKILHLMEKITQSQGIAKVKKMLGKTRYRTARDTIRRICAEDVDPLISLRQKYREYFDKRLIGNDPEQVLGEALGEDEPQN